MYYKLNALSFCSNFLPGINDCSETNFVNLKINKLKLEKILIDDLSTYCLDYALLCSCKCEIAFISELIQEIKKTELQKKSVDVYFFTVWYRGKK